MESRRAQRVSEALREELSELVSYELQDPRLIGVTVTEARLSPDGRHAHVLVTLGGQEKERAGALEALEHAKNLLRRHVATRLQLFRAPELHFEEDTADGNGETRVDKLLKRIHKTSAKAQKTAATNPNPSSLPADSSKKTENSPDK